MEEGTCFNGGDIAGAIFGTLIAVVITAAVVYWLYIKHLNKKRREAQLMLKKDAENVDEYAFDNPAFKGETTKTASPLEPTWTPKLNGGRKAMDDSFIAPTPRVVPLRGSDFTGLGIELCGGLKEGIYVKKVMSQGPAAETVNPGDRILSLTIDFRHVVQEDAMTILSYASPYNIKLELVDGKGVIGTTSSPKSGRSTLQHPLYRSSSQTDVSTIERNAKKTLFPDTDVKDEKRSSTPVDKVKVQNEKKPSLTQQVKNLITEKLSSRSAEPKHEKLEKSESTNTTIDEHKENDDKKSGLKFGIRVLPPAVGDRLFGKSPSKMQADNENNTNMEKKEENQKKDEEIIKESEIKIDIEPTPKVEAHLERQGIVTSSGIRRDSDGIPLEMPNHMMQAAMSARDNRPKSCVDLRQKSKGKAPMPPPESLDSSTATEDTVIDMDMTDHAKALVDEAIQSATSQISKMNFTNDFTEASEHPEGHHSKNSTPESGKKRLSSDTESQMAHESDFETTGSDSNRIELNSSDITVHHGSEEEEGDDSGRRTHSLGDLSKAKMMAQDESGTLERAQSLDITDSVTKTKRKAPTDVDIIENKELGLMEKSSDSMHGTLKSANQWGNLADYVFEDKSSDKEDGSVHDVPLSETTIDLVRDVMNVVDNIDAKDETSDRESDDEDVPYLKYHIEKPPRASKTDSGVIIRGMIEKKDVAMLNDNYNNMVTINNMDPVQEIVKQSEQFMIQINNEMNENGAKMEDAVNNFRVETQTMFLETNGDTSNDTDQIKITGNYDTNVPDDMKASRYPFNSLERPKSDVLKKLVQTTEIEPAVQITTTTTTTTIKPVTMDPQPVSLTLINTTPASENEMTESSQNSPVYSSDNHGVNSISISSNLVLPDVVTKPTETKKNVVMISNTSQPSSIIMIEDETLDFTLQAPDEEDDPELDTFKKLEDAVTKNAEEMFVIEMNNGNKEETSKKEDENKVNGNYVTEITVKSTKKPAENNKSASNSPEMRKTAAKPPLSRGKSTEYTNGNGRKSSSSSPSPNRETSPKSKLSKIGSFQMQERRHTETNFIPRNNEIKFTQSTYESPLSKSYEKRSSQIEQLRSNFENKSDIPVRKSSIPTLKNGSPSKIPVSKQRSPSQDRNKVNGTNGTHSNRGSTTNLAQPLVSVTSIKNSSKHPSGK
ncbi:uncharacterized protein LOC134827257 [Culicoides brevitarsis]|uniref:uncharacterized protein LOC134827257 n=1 Tax=Culicoides brevitarsis TaxID=469753 RepID=UPI00307C0FD0